MTQCQYHTAANLQQESHTENQFNRLSQLLLFVFLLIATALSAETYYVDASAGNNSNSGRSETTAWRTVEEVTNRTFQPGDVILFKRGEVWLEELEVSVNSNGTAASPIRVGAYGTGVPPVLQRVTARGQWWIFEDFEVNRQKEGGTAFRLIGAHNSIIRNLEIHNGTSDGVDVNGSNDVLIENCEIHHFLRGSFSSQEDAHGIAAQDVDGLTIRGTNIHHFSGDAFQTDPDRDTNTPNNILIEDCEMWTGPLDEDFNSWNAGEVPGENAVDTKLVKEGWDSVTRMQITIRNTVAHGFVADGFINNRAAFNMKEKIEAVFDGVTVYNCEIAFRLRGTRGNANVTLINAVVYDCDKAIRAEDDLSNLRVFNSTFGDGLPTHIQFAGGSGGTPTWDIRNNAFLGSKPSVASDVSNEVTAASDFINASGRDYRIAGGSNLIDTGNAIAEVTQDRDGNQRPQGISHDIGAYEFTDSTTGLETDPQNAITDFVLGQNYPNPFNPSTRFQIDLARQSQVVVEVYDLTGRLVTTLLNEPLEAGVHTVNFEAADLPSGPYFYRVNALGTSKVRRMILMK